MSPAALPDADYVVLGSRIALGLDAGFAVAAATRLRLLDAAGAPRPLLLSLDAAPPEVHDAQRREFVDRGLVTSVDRMRNLFDETATEPSWLYAAGAPGAATPGVAYRTMTDASGEPVVSLPVFPGDPQWHLRDASIVVHGPDGDRVLHGFAALYIAWLAHIAEDRRTAAGDPDRLFVVVCESRQVGELLVDWDDPRVRVVHGVHNSHLPPPYDDPDAPIDGLWNRWLAVVDRFDAVLWPTPSQRDDVVSRFGAHEGFSVVANSVASGPEPVDPASRDPRLVVMITRLADQKRVDLAIEAWRQVDAAVPGARLDIYGDGPLRESLEGLIRDLGLTESVRLRGFLDDPVPLLDTAAMVLVSSAFEGQSIALAEALARGAPVVSFDVRYGPRDVLGGGGIIVPPGDVEALGAAVTALLGDAARRTAMSVAARKAARALSPEVAQSQLVAALAGAVARPSRRRGHSRPGHTFPAHGS